MEETKACPRALSRSHDQLRKTKVITPPLRSCFLFLQGYRHTADDTSLNHPITEEENKEDEGQNVWRSEPCVALPTDACGSYVSS